jgi:hypothetical protein
MRRRDDASTLRAGFNAVLFSTVMKSSSELRTRQRQRQRRLSLESPIDPGFQRLTSKLIDII